MLLLDHNQTSFKAPFSSVQGSNNIVIGQYLSINSKDSINEISKVLEGILCYLVLGIKILQYRHERISLPFSHTSKFYIPVLGKGRIRLTVFRLFCPLAHYSFFQCSDNSNKTLQRTFLAVIPLPTIFMGTFLSNAAPE